MLLEDGTIECFGSLSCWGPVGLYESLIPATIYYDTFTNTATLTPTIPLAAEQTYTATIWGSSENGTSMQAESDWSFMTEEAAPDTHTIYVIAVEKGGSINPSANVTVTSGSTQDFTVTPDSGYQIDSVTGCGGSLAGASFITAAIIADCTLTATFTPIIHTLGVTVTGQGTVYSSPGGDMQCTDACTQGFDHDTIVTLTADSDSNYTFAGWSGDCTGTGDCTVSMDAAKSVTATFSINSASYPFILESSQTGYPSIQLAYNNIGNSDVIKVKASYPITETLVFDRDVTIRFEGGYDEVFSGIVSRRHWMAV